jgi:hypothetical protein
MTPVYARFQTCAVTASNRPTAGIGDVMTAAMATSATFASVSVRPRPVKTMRPIAALIQFAGDHVSPITRNSHDAATATAARARVHGPAGCSPRLVATASRTSNATRRIHAAIAGATWLGG